MLTTADAIITQLVETQDDNAPPKAAKAARRAKFVAKGLAADFAPELAADRAAIDDAQGTENSADAEGVQNTAAIGRLGSDGMKECNYLDAIFHNVYARNPEKLRAGLSASHLERAPRREKKPAPPPSWGRPADCQSAKPQVGNLRYEAEVHGKGEPCKRKQRHSLFDMRRSEELNRCEFVTPVFQPA